MSVLAANVLLSIVLIIAVVVLQTLRNKSK